MCVSCANAQNLCQIHYQRSVTICNMRVQWQMRTLALYATQYTQHTTTHVHATSTTTTTHRVPLLSSTKTNKLRCDYINNFAAGLVYANRYSAITENSSKLTKAYGKHNDQTDRNRSAINLQFSSSPASQPMNNA